MAKHYFQVLILLIAAYWTVSCGVKGDPLPPDQPPFIGHGHADFKKAFVNDKPAPAPAVKDTDNKEKKNDEDSDKDEDQSDE